MVGVLGVTWITWVTRRHSSLGIQMVPKSLAIGIGVEHGNVVGPSRRKKVTRKGAGDPASMRVKKKRMAVCSGRYTGSRFARHESEQTSSWCFGARNGIKLILEGKANDGLTAGAPFAVFREEDGQSLIHQYRAVCLGIGVSLLVGLGRAMACRAYRRSVLRQFGKRVVKESAFEGLEPYDGKLSRTVLRGRRAVRP
jgi:hypothetical protein